MVAPEQFAFSEKKIRQSLTGTLVAYALRASYGFFKMKLGRLHLLDEILLTLGISQH